MTEAVVIASALGDLDTPIRCRTCHGFGQWWEWQEGSVVRRDFCAVRPPASARAGSIPAAARRFICGDCEGGITIAIKERLAVEGRLAKAGGNQ